MARRATSYLYLRGTTWWLKIQTPGQKVIRRSLGTSDRLAAEVKALPDIQTHKRHLLLMRSIGPQGESVWQGYDPIDQPDPVAVGEVYRYQFDTIREVVNPDGTRMVATAVGIFRLDADLRLTTFTRAPFEYAYQYELGKEVVNPDGSRTHASREHVVHIDASGRMRVEPNVRTNRIHRNERIVWQCSPQEALAVGMTPERVAGMTFKTSPDAKPKATGVDPDLKLLDDFLDLQPRTKHYEADARNTWKRWKAFIGDKPLSKCTRDDGRAFVKHLRAQDPPPAPVTLRKWLSLLKAPIAHGTPKHDPRRDVFDTLIKGVKVQTKRIPLSEADMAAFREQALPTQGPEETRLWAMMATTGMRPSECTAVREEFEESGVRYLMVGVGDKQAKSATSIRRVPIPDALMPFLPDRIEGPLFTKGEVRLGANLLRAMRRVGITDKRKVVYSLRHRAHDRLRGVACPPDIQREIVGHDIETVHRHYGIGSPMHLLKNWVEHIGW